MRLLALTTLISIACTKTALPSAPADIQERVALSRAASCESLQKTVQDTAVRQMRSQLDAEKSWAWGPMAMGGAGSATPQAASAPASYSTTNTQVAGVDEADFVKNDGTRIFVLSGHKLYAARSWPPQSLALVGTLDLEGWPSEMFLDGDRLAVFSSIWTMPSGGGMGPGYAGGAPMMRPCGLDGAGCFFGWGTTKVTVVDVSDLSALAVSAELYLPGSSAGARRVQSSVRLVLSDSVRWPEAIKWWPDYDPALSQDHDAWAAALDALESANEAVIRATPIQRWFPESQRKAPDGTLVDVGYQCSDFFLSNAPERLGLVTIATIDLAHLDAGVSRASIVGEAGVLYANASHLYLASEHWWWWPSSGQRDFTYVHEFDITDPATAGYVGSGGVEGHVGDQFAMDEKDGYLRVATSTERYSDEPSAVDGAVAGSRLSVLAPQEGELKLIGELAPLQEGERLTAMRFIGDTGYAVTFRNIDPLVTLDLSDPAHPKKIAELTIPGFSTYLQPIDATHLLAIGEDLPVDDKGIADWSKRSVELSLFDVSDLSHPKRTAQALVGTAWANSEALWDHHAFNWYQPGAGQAGLLAIPFSDWIVPSSGQPWWDGFVSDVRVFSVDPAGGIAPLGALAVSDVYIEKGSGDWTWWYRPWVRRSVMATDQSGQSFVYAVSDAGVRVAALGHLDAPLATALFPQTP